MNDYIEMKIAKTISHICKIRDIRVNNSNNVKKIIVLSLGVIGDNIIMSPFYRNLKYNFPKSEVSVICKESMRTIFERSPYIDKLYFFERIISGKHKFERNIFKIYRFVEQNFSGVIFDLVIAPRYLALSIDIIMCSMIRSRRRILYVGDIHIPNGIHITDTGNKCDHSIKHMVERELFILQAASLKIYDDFLEIWTNTDDKNRINTLFNNEKFDDKKLKLVVFLGTSAPYKDWPVEKYIATCKKLLMMHNNLEIILLGAKDNTEKLGYLFCEEIKDAHNLIGKTSITESIEAVCRCDLFLGGDTGTMHMAAAAKLYGVVVVKDYSGAHDEYGSPMDNFAPWQAPIEIICPDRPLPGCEIQCNKMEAHCIKQVPVDAVVDAMNRAIEKRIINGKLRYMRG